VRFQGDVAVVTGATLGIGRATAIAFARDGARVIVHGRSPERSSEVVEAIREEGGTAAVFLGDLAESSAVQQLMEFAQETYGGIDILVNNARFSVAGSVLDLSEADWDYSMAVMLKSAFLACKHALPSMLARERGSIINISSRLRVGEGSVDQPHQAACGRIRAAWNSGQRGLSRQHLH
jgi:NAD(P)-dependent dehydrogenase (short-subunit alcohol dehydrogenase family)